MFDKTSRTKQPPARWRSIAAEIDRLESRTEKLDGAALRKESLSLRYLIRSGTPPDEILPRAFALVRESARRQIGQRHYPVQMLGGIALHFGSIAVMQTGEGKTLTATLPLYLAGLSGRGAHLATANDYLSARDAQLMGPIFEALGMSVGSVQSSTPPGERYQAYRCDITYSTATEIGFDFLRDRLRARQLEIGGDSRKLVSAEPINQSGSQFLLPPLHSIIIDEADSILIDEARTPLVISSQPLMANEKKCLFRWAAKVAQELCEPNEFIHDDRTRQSELTTAGRLRIRKLAKPPELSGVSMLEIYEQVELALQVDRQFKRDRHYIIRDGELVIIDENTGRIAEGRKWRAGIHQAIEAREHLEVTLPTSEAARITIQDLFLKYPHLSGMTGTVVGDARELRKIYSTPVVEVPTNKPSRRRRWNDRVFVDCEAKWQAIADEIDQVRNSGRPVLVGTRSIDRSEQLSSLLHQRGIPHDVLNARHLPREAQIVEAAGQPGKVTVATNMAGRGTDIALHPDACAAGGLHVIVSELHESGRIDRQLTGRCARQGDPGSYRFFMSLQDEILPARLGANPASRLSRAKRGASSEMTGLTRLFRLAQKAVERRHFRARRMLLLQERQNNTMLREMGQDPYVDAMP